MKWTTIQIIIASVLLLVALAMVPLSSSFAASAPHATASISVDLTNPFSPAYQHSYRQGVLPTTKQWQQMHSYQNEHPQVAAASTNKTLTYGGGIDGIGVTSGKEKVYLVFWGQQWGLESTNNKGNLTFSGDPMQAAPYLQSMFKGLGTGGEKWSGTMTQYCDGPSVKNGATSCPAGAPHVGYPTGGALAGVWYDNSGLEPAAATGHDLAQEAINAAAHFGNKTAASNRYAQYVIVSSPLADPDNFLLAGFCAWHDYNSDKTLSGGAATSPYGDVAFTNLPYVANMGTLCGANFVNAGSTGLVDGFSVVEGHEYAETITDQNPAGGWTNPTGGENGDECAWIKPGQNGGGGNVMTSNGAYAMQATWSNDTNECDLAHAIV